MKKVMRVNWTVTPEQNAWLQEEAYRRHMNVSEVIRKLVDRFRSQVEAKKNKKEVK